MRWRLRSSVSGEGEYTIPTSTVFGLKEEEIRLLLGEGLKVEPETVTELYTGDVQVKDSDRRIEGLEVHGASPFKVCVCT